MIKGVIFYKQEQNVHEIDYNNKKNVMIMGDPKISVIKHRIPAS